MPENDDDAWVMACSSFLIYLGGDLTSLGKLMSKRKYAKVENCVKQLKQGCNVALFVSQGISTSSTLEAAKTEYEGVLTTTIKLADECHRGVVEMTKGERVKAATHINDARVLMENVKTRFPNIPVLLGR